MKILASVLLPALFATAAVASALPFKRGDKRCCIHAQVNHLVQICHQHITNQAAADATAAILAEGYSQYSESVNSLAGTPVRTTRAPSRSSTTASTSRGIGVRTESEATSTKYKAFTY